MKKSMKKIAVAASAKATQVAKAPATSTKATNGAKAPATSTKATNGAKAPATSAKVPKAAGPKNGASSKVVTAERLSAIDAAAQVLKSSGQAMRTAEMIAAMAEKKLWSSPNGKTPAATLYSAILREINTKGRDARFRKIERGKFELAGNGR